MNGHPYPQQKYWSPDQIGRQPQNGSTQGQQQYQGQQQHAPQPPPPKPQPYQMQQFAPPPQQQQIKSSGGSLLKSLNFFSSKSNVQPPTNTMAERSVGTMPMRYNEVQQFGQQQAPPPPPQNPPPPPPPPPPQDSHPQQQQQPPYNPQSPQRHSSQTYQQDPVRIHPSQMHHSGQPQPQDPPLPEYKPNPPPPAPPKPGPPPHYAGLPAHLQVDNKGDVPPRTPPVPHTSFPRSEPIPVEIHSSLKAPPPPPPPPPPLQQHPGHQPGMNTTTITTINTTTTVINSAPNHRHSMVLPILPLYPGMNPEKRAPSPLPPKSQLPPQAQQPNIKIPETTIAGNAPAKARGLAHLFWGYLFDESTSPPEPKPILKEFFEQLAGYIISTWEKNYSAVISPDTMALYYYALTERGSSRIDFFISALGSPNPIIALYQLLGCQYLLIPPRYKPSDGNQGTAGRKKMFVQPGLTTAGFVQWMVVNTLVDPQREFIRLNRLLRTTGVVIPRKDPSATPFPDVLPRGALPEGPNEAATARWGKVFNGFGVTNEEIAKKVAQNLQEWGNGIEGVVGHMGPGTAGDPNVGAGKGEAEKDEEINRLWEELENAKQGLWDKEQELKRLKVQLGQMQQQQHQQSQAQAAAAQEEELRRRQSTSSNVSSLSTHSRSDYQFAHAFRDQIFDDGPARPSPVPTPMPEPIIPGYTTPIQEKRASLQHRQTMPNLPHGMGSRMTPTPPPLPRHHSVDLGQRGGPGGGALGGSAIGGYRPFQPLTPVQSPVLGSSDRFIDGASADAAAEWRRSSTATIREGLPASLCISPVQEHQGGGWGREREMPGGYPMENQSRRQSVMGPAVPDKFKRDDEFARILGSDV